MSALEAFAAKAMTALNRAKKSPRTESGMIEIMDRLTGLTAAIRHLLKNTEEGKKTRGKVMLHFLSVQAQVHEDLHERYHEVYDAECGQEHDEITDDDDDTTGREEV